MELNSEPTTVAGQQLHDQSFAESKLLVSPSHTYILTPQNFERTVLRTVSGQSCALRLEAARNDFSQVHRPFFAGLSTLSHFAPTWNYVDHHFEAKTDPGAVRLARVSCAISGGASTVRPPSPHWQCPDFCNENGITLSQDTHKTATASWLKHAVGTEFQVIVEYLNAHAQPMATSVDEVEVTTPPEHLVVQTRRSNPNPSGTVVALNIQPLDSYTPHIHQVLCSLVAFLVVHSHPTGVATARNSPLHASSSDACKILPRSTANDTMHEPGRYWVSDGVFLRARGQDRVHRCTVQ